MNPQTSDLETWTSLQAWVCPSVVGKVDPEEKKVELYETRKGE